MDKIRACLRFGHLAKKRPFYRTFPPFFRCVALLRNGKKEKN